ncbi:MAG TPA: ABC transporter permease [Acidimicrobiia bacterium]
MTSDTMAGRPSILRLVWSQIKYQNKIFWRTPIAAFFTLVFPLMLLVLFTAIFGNDQIEGLGVTTAQFYTPGLAVFAAVSATYTNLAIGTSISRDAGILKRVRGTPIPPVVYIAGRIGSAVYIAFLAVVVMMGVGIAFYGVELFPRTLAAALLTFLVGTSCFAALGMFVAAVSPNGDTTPAITNGTLLPIAFISDVFIPLNDPPGWMVVAGDFFPLKPFAVVFREAFDPTLSGAQFHWPELGQLVVWGMVAAALAIRFFKWEPISGGSRRRGNRDLE